jgi:hypothetical protein
VQGGTRQVGLSRSAGSKRSHHRQNELELHCLIAQAWPGGQPGQCKSGKNIDQLVCLCMSTHTHVRYYSTRALGLDKAQCTAQGTMHSANAQPAMHNAQPWALTRLKAQHSTGHGLGCESGRVRVTHGHVEFSTPPVIAGKPGKLRTQRSPLKIRPNTQMRCATLRPNTAHISLPGALQTHHQANTQAVTYANKDLLAAAQ